MSVRSQKKSKVDSTVDQGKSTSQGSPKAVGTTGNCRLKKSCKNISRSVAPRQKGSPNIPALQQTHKERLRLIVRIMELRDAESPNGQNVQSAEPTQDRQSPFYESCNDRVD